MTIPCVCVTIEGFCLEVDNQRKTWLYSTLEWVSPIKGQGGTRNRCRYWPRIHFSPNTCPV